MGSLHDKVIGMSQGRGICALLVGVMGIWASPLQILCDLWACFEPDPRCPTLTVWWIASEPLWVMMGSHGAWLLDIP